MSSVLITGAAGGIGTQTVQQFARRGWTVFASDLTEAIARTAHGARPGVHPLALDVTSEQSVSAARAQIEAQLEGRALDVVVNNAGIGLMGPITEMRDEDARRMFEVNALGVLRVTRAFAPQMAEQGRGRIVNVGSLAGLCTLPFLGAYCASKHAVEAITDAMRLELRPRGIRVSLVQPAIVNTGFVDKAMTSLQGYALQSQAWRAPLEKTGSLRVALQRTELSPDAVALTVLRAATARWPRARYPVGRMASLLIGLMKLLPTFLSDGVLRAAVDLNAAPAPAMNPRLGSPS
jgi:NAD(P)-dependent dehydrogenase (short-subunit alcohol dehydrogenase family)